LTRKSTRAQARIVTAITQPAQADVVQIKADTLYYNLG